MRILIAPHEICGQMQMLAEGLRKRGIDATAVAYSAPGIFSHKTDLCLHLENSQPTWKRFASAARFAWRAAPQFDVFHFFAGRSLLPRNLDLWALRRMGKKIVVHFHGSDVRQHKYLSRVVERSLTGQEVQTDIAMSSNGQSRMLRRWQRYADLILVSIPELLPLVPEAELFQPAIDLPRWRFSPEEAAQAPHPVVIGHATTNRKCKGTKYVIRAVEQLRDAGHDVELHLIENVPHGEMATHYARCHLGVDELIQGSYGIVSMELMAMGKPVVANLLPWYQEQRPDLPVVPAGPEDLAEKLKMLVEDQTLRLDLGHRGRRYVERWHGIDTAVENLLSLYARHLRVGVPARDSVGAADIGPATSLQRHYSA